MAQITIDNLPAMETLTEKELAAILGAGFRPSFEQLESREVMSANVATSTLGGVLASFSLNNGILSETTGPKVGVVASGVSELVQGTNSSGQC